MGSELYEQEITFTSCPNAAWAGLRKSCAGGIGSLVELLEGRFSSDVMTRMTAREGALLPTPSQVQMSCSCPDWASLCKHLAAVMYGVGARLDERPELLFLLRGVDPTELVTAAVQSAQQSTPAPSATLAGDLGDIFGIELAPDVEAAERKPERAPRVEPAPKQREKVETSEKPQNPNRRQPARAAEPRRKGPARTVTRQELLTRGIPAGTISTWLHQGVLVTTPGRGTYRHTAASLQRLDGRVDS